MGDSTGSTGTDSTGTAHSTGTDHSTGPYAMKNHTKCFKRYFGHGNDGIVDEVYMRFCEFLRSAGELWAE